jgi:hypothetical protein
MGDKDPELEPFPVSPSLLDRDFTLVAIQEFGNGKRPQPSMGDRNLDPINCPLLVSRPRQSIGPVDEAFGEWGIALATYLNLPGGPALSNGSHVARQSL